MNLCRFGRFCIKTYMKPTLVLLGEVLAALNVAQVLRRSPHPNGPLAAEATRLTGGFELRWEAGPYDIDSRRSSKGFLILLG